MKELIIMRHAKSSWADEGATDHERRLNERGRRDAPVMGALLAEQSLVPDKIVCSTATRAKTTAQLVAQAIAKPEIVSEVDELYLAPPQVYLRIATQADASTGRLLLVGHNPGIETLAGTLLGTYTRMPTAAMVYVQLDLGNWSEMPSQLEPADPIVLKALVWRPKEL